MDDNCHIAILGLSGMVFAMDSRYQNHHMTSGTHVFRIHRVYIICGTKQDLLDLDDTVALHCYSCILHYTV